jgi:hypothetical protein
MGRPKLTRENTLDKSGGGFKYFKAVISGLTVRSDNNTKCYPVDSPFHNEKKRCLNIGIYQGIWQYFDNGGRRYHGDVFNFVARTKNLNQNTEEFYEILKIINETVEYYDLCTINERTADEDTTSITYAADYLYKIIFEKFFGEICRDISKTYFDVKLIERAQFTDATGEPIELVSDLVKNENVFFSFSNSCTGIEVIYNPWQEQVFYACKDSVSPSSFIFGWYEYNIWFCFGFSSMYVF